MTLTTYHPTIMLIKNPVVSILYKLVFIVLCFYGLYLNSGLPQGSLKGYVFNYYTIVSNVICLVFFIFAVSSNIISFISDRTVTPYQPRVKDCVLMCITVTMLIYNFILAPIQFSMGAAQYVYSAANVIPHYVVPVMVILDWVLFDAKGNFRWFEPFLWIIIPYLYFAYILVRAEVAGDIGTTESRFPYRFIDVDKYGCVQVFKNVGKLTLIFIGLGYVILAIDRVWGNAVHRHDPTVKRTFG